MITINITIIIVIIITIIVTSIHFVTVINFLILFFYCYSYYIFFVPVSNMYVSLGPFSFFFSSSFFDWFFKFNYLILVI